MLAAAIETCRKEGPGEYTGVHLGGNIGRSLLGDLDTIRSTDLVVLEMSNAQLEDLPRIDWAPSVAVITNLKPHHLDRYDTYADYVRAKLNIVGNARHTERVVVGDLDAEAERVFQSVVAGKMCRVVRVSRPDPPVELRIPGDHNQANVACVLTVCEGLGLDGAAVRESMRSFGGLPHRLEFVRTLDGVDYYNDSKSTSPSTTLTAVRALDRTIVAIVGGQIVGRIARPDVTGSAAGVEPDESDLRPWADELLCACRTVICTGEAGPKFARVLRAVEGGTQESGVREAAGTVEAIRLARGQARQGDVVLFSPGAPSFDAYANFADRGRHFVETVKAMS
jgi:UDP-N-acetylmuramoylalanine--D-glutamate ligase